GTGSGGIVPFNSGVRGVLMAGPTCPVERDPPDPNCADRPLETIVAIYRASDTARAHVVTRSNAQGEFEASLAPGEYVIVAGQSPFPQCNETNVTVTPNSFLRIEISCDTGIR
ncbi:MAG TPA: hypothetical protein VD928_03135, partial [Candidatus Paceibacterota bacterium]|nr:hypothetical protein [Candidatus Paceibacterota bacterium]